MTRFTFTTPTTRNSLVAALMLGLVSASNATAQVDISSRNVVSNSGNGKGNTIITNNHAAGAFSKTSGETRVTASNVIRNSGNGSDNKIVTSNHATAASGSVGEARVKISNTIEDSGNGDGNLVVGSNHVTIDGSQLGPGEVIQYRNEIRKRGNGTGSVVISSDEFTLQCPSTQPNPPASLKGSSLPQVTNPGKTSRTISTRIGRQFVVELESDPSIGARWDLRYDQRKLLIVKRQTVQTEIKGLEVERFTFVSLSPGTSSIVLNYGQPGQKTSKSTVMEVNVRLY